MTGSPSLEPSLWKEWSRRLGKESVMLHGVKAPEDRVWGFQLGGHAHTQQVGHPTPADRSSPAVELQTSPKGGGRPAVPLTRSRTAPSQSSDSHFRTELSPGRLHLQITACQLARGDAQAHDWYLMSVLGARLLIRRDVSPLWGRVRTGAGLEPSQALRTPSRCPTPWFI